MFILTARRRHLLTAFHDTCMAGISFLLALYLRLGDETGAMVGRALPFTTALCMLVSLLVFSRMRLYRGLWRYASAPDLVAITKSATVAVLLVYIVLFLFSRLEGIPRSVPFIQWLLLLALLGGPRFFYRLLRDRQMGMRTSFSAESRIPVVLIGAGDRAELFLRDTRSGTSSQYHVVGIVDDDPERIGRTIHNVRIWGPVSELPAVVERFARRGVAPQRAILAGDTLEGSRVRQLLDITDRLGLPLARLPRLSEFKPGMGEALDIRPIAVEDLLGRAQAVHENKPVADFITGKAVLVTGAGGTIGSELVRQIAGFHPRRIVLFELSEYALYQIDMEVAGLFPGLPRAALIGDVRDAAHLQAVFAAEKPEIVFHAAAIKHVPLAESNPEEAVLTNVFGTRCVADACMKAGVLVMLLISTDKAVNPSSLMGATKRVAENYCQALANQAAANEASQQAATRFVTVRFGNVLGSTGSVVPLFQKQLSSGGPITVTHPDMVRYFMTVREAVELVLQAATLSNRSGEVYVLDMGQPVRILDLAEQMIRLAGLKPYEDIPIEFTGLRPGEKMFEELFHFSENSTRTAHESVWLADQRTVSLPVLATLLGELHGACLKRNAAQTVEVMRRLVPEYRRAPDAIPEKITRKA